VTGRAIGDDEFIQQFGAWEVLKDVDAFTNDISLTWDFDRGSATFGYYASSVSSNDLWALGNSEYQVVEQGGEIVTGIACNDPAVDSCGFNYDIDGRGDATTNALYAATTFDITDRLTADVGVRYEEYEVDYTLDEGRAGTIDFAASEEVSETSWTAALNYQFTDRMGVFGRVNQGHLLPQFDTYRDSRAALASGNDLVQDIDQYEVGFKWATDNLSLYATAFFTDVDPRAVNFEFGGEAILTTQESQGVELDGIWQTDGGFSVAVNATWLESDINSGDPTIDGNETERQPGWQVRLTPAYDFSFGNMAGSVYATYTAVDDRWGEALNINVLEGYDELDLGVIMRINESFIVQVAADNITDEEALTESDPRTFTAPNGRFIMPRNIRFTVGYEF
jgi:iron complex outermembrane receptor protein